MELSKFMKIVCKKRIEFTRFCKGVFPWAIYEGLADLTQYIDYDCRFKDGMCKQYPPEMMKHVVSNIYQTGMCCCKNCAPSVGHGVSRSIFHLEEYAELYHAKLGFWRKGKGCILPRKMHSNVCLGHRCGHKVNYDHPLSLEILNTLHRIGDWDFYPQAHHHEETMAIINKWQWLGSVGWNTAKKELETLIEKLKQENKPKGK